LLHAYGKGLKSCSSANQGIWNSLKYSAWVTAFTLTIIFIGLSGITSLLENKDDLIGSSLQRNLSGALQNPLNIGFFFGGGGACIQHFCLRIILTRHYKIPWNLARFLNYCTERRLLQRIGGRYRFIHRELLEYFAGLE
jgi:hypothetical protein